MIIPKELGTKNIEIVDFLPINNIKTGNKEETEINRSASLLWLDLYKILKSGDSK
ncbi:hypothetical protein ABEY80_16930 [Priestia megaterium]